MKQNCERSNDPNWLTGQERSTNGQTVGKVVSKISGQVQPSCNCKLLFRLFLLFNLFFVWFLIRFFITLFVGLFVGFLNLKLEIESKFLNYQSIFRYCYMHTKRPRMTLKAKIRLKSRIYFEGHIHHATGVPLPSTLRLCFHRCLRQKPFRLFFRLIFLQISPRVFLQPSWHENDHESDRARPWRGGRRARRTWRPKFQVEHTNQWSSRHHVNDHVLRDHENGHDRG